MVTSFFNLCSDYLFKVLLIGNSGVGKSSLLLRFAVSKKYMRTVSNFSRFLVFSHPFRTMFSTTTLCQPSVLISKLEQLKLTVRKLNCKSGTQLDKRDSRLSPVVIIRELTVSLLLTISQTEIPSPR